MRNYDGVHKMRNDANEQQQQTKGKKEHSSVKALAVLLWNRV